MSEVKPEVPSAKRGGWLKYVIWTCGGLLGLVVIAYFVVTSGGFIRGVIVPKVGAALNADLAVGDVELSPFSQLVLKDVKLTPKGKETLFTAGLVRARYHLMDIIGGNIAVDDVTVESPTVTLIRNADGTSNLDPLTQSSGKSAPQPATKAVTLKLDIKAVALKNATVKITTQQPGGGRQVVELANVNLSVGDLKNGGTGKLDLGAAIAFEQVAGTNSANLAAKLDGTFTFDLTPELRPGKVGGKLGVAVEKAGGTMAELATLAVNLDADATPTEIKNLAVHFNRSGETLGLVRLSGPFDATKLEGKLNLEIPALDRRVLNLAGAAAGIDFGTTVLSTTNVVELSKAGAMIVASGHLGVDHLSITRQKQTTPTLDLRCDYAVTVDNTSKAATIQKLNLTGLQGGRPLLQTDLAKPMSVSFGGANAAAGDAALGLKITGLNLADWSAFAADLHPAGVVDAAVKLESLQGGKLLNFDLDAGIAGLAATVGTNAISPATVKAQARGQGTDLKQFKLDSFKLDLTPAAQNALSVSGSGAFDAGTKAAEFEVALRAVLPALLAWYPQPGANLTGGTVDLTGHLSNQAKGQAVTGKLNVAGLSGSYSSFQLKDLGVTTTVDLGVTGNQLALRQANGKVTVGGAEGGSFAVSGNLDTQKQAGQFIVGLTNLNETALRPFLQTALADKQLVSVTINASATARLEANRDAAVTGDFKVANLVVRDPKGANPTTPLELKAQLDAGLAKQVATIRQCQLTLTPTERAANQVNLSGQVDLSRSNAITGNVKLASDGIDVTRYYDLFSGGATPAASKPVAPAPAGELQEPQPVTLPLTNFTVAANVGRFYLREVAITNFQFGLRVDPSHVLVKPAQMVLNGAPVSASADVDLGVVGYKYEVALNGDKIPLEPFVNSFLPDRKGQFHGVTLANAQIKGAGITGPNLKKYLSGDFGFATTNLNLSIANVRNPIVFAIINTIVAIPDLVRNPAATIGNLLTGFKGASKGGFADELTAAPIQSTTVRGKIAGGHVTLELAEVNSAAFRVNASGDIALADVLTNSTIRIPVQIALNRAMAERVGLAGNTPTNALLAQLPDFLTMTGTVGAPKPEKNNAVLATLGAKAIVGVAGQLGGAVGDKAGGVLNAVEGLLTGHPAPAATTSNVPPANVQTQQPVNLLDLFKKPKKK